MKIDILGTITRVPKGLGWKPGYPAAWKKLEDCHTWEDYQSILEQETRLLGSDYQAQENNLKYWPEVHVDGSALHKSKAKKELKKWLKEIAFINHLGPYKGWLFPTAFGDSLEIKIGSGHRAIHQEDSIGTPLPLNYLPVDDKGLSAKLEENGFIVDGKSTVYSYKVSDGNITLPSKLMHGFEKYASQIAGKINFSYGAGFTIDYMLSSSGIYPIEMHSVPLGIIHDFSETCLSEKSLQFAKVLSDKHKSIAIYTDASSLASGFYKTEIDALASHLSYFGADVVFTADPSAIPEKAFVLPYKGDVSKLNGNLCAYPKEHWALFENKLAVNDLLEECSDGTFKKPKYSVIQCPEFFKSGETFSKFGSFANDLEKYKSWKAQSRLPEWVVIKPIDHHGWPPQILNLNDLSDAVILFSHAGKHGQIIVENMVADNLILSNGEIRMFYQVI